MVANSTTIAYEPLKSVNSSTFDGSFLPLGGPTSHPVRIFKIVNDSTVPVTLSVDGSTAVDFIPAGSFVLYDVGTNRGNSAPEICLPPTQFYVSASAGTGSVYAVVLYANTPYVSIPSI